MWVLPFDWITAAWAVVILLCFWQTLKLVLRASRKSKLKSAIRKRHEERTKELETLREQRLADDESLRNEILKMNFTELTEHLRKEAVSCGSVLQAYQWACLEAQKKSNCVTQFISEAEDWAEALDIKYNGSDNKPPLFGLPFSVKESIAIKGYDTTRGYAQFIGQKASEDAVIVKSLKELGAVPFVRGNIPQSLLSFHCANPIYGRTDNPQDSDRTSGGSSGGDAAIVALGGAVFSIGGDVGGSIRIPAHFCGVAGIKPSHTRMSQMGSLSSVPGRPAICASCGPMAKDAKTLVEIMRHLLSAPTMADEDFYTAPVPFREKEFLGTRKLRVGFYVEDHWFEAVPACRRAVKEAKEALEAAGHVLVRFNPPNVSEAVSLFAAAALVDGGTYLLNTVDKDIPERLNAPMVALYRIPHWLRYWLGRVLKPFLKRTSAALMAIPRSTAELREVYEKIGIYRANFAKEWKVLKLDCLICPAFASPALPHDIPVKTLAMVSWTGLYNLLDYCAGVVPWTNVTENDVRETLETYRIEDFMSRMVRNANGKESVGLPVGVQCIAPAFREEMCLRLMKEIEEVKKN